jgi:hypothetical protein
MMDGEPKLDRAALRAKLLGRLASLSISGETARQLIEEEGRRAASAGRRGRLDFGWTANDCRTAEGTTRVYLGCDGVKDSLVTDAEKRKRRADSTHDQAARGAAATDKNWRSKRLPVGRTPPPSSGSPAATRSAPPPTTNFNVRSSRHDLPLQGFQGNPQPSRHGKYGSGGRLHCWSNRAYEDYEALA